MTRYRVVQERANDAQWSNYRRDGGFLTLDKSTLIVFNPQIYVMLGIWKNLEPSKVYLTKEEAEERILFENVARGKVVSEFITPEIDI